MLIALQIENYAIIKSLQLTFDSGFTAITGETGAGKSILLGALSLILGHRADTSVLYDKSKKCIVEGSFNIDGLHLEPFFNDNELDYNDITILRREISETGKSRAFINDTPVNLTQLRDLAQFLVDIHSQNNHLLIENQNFKIQIIDNFSKNTKLVIQYKDLLSEYKSVENELLNLIDTRDRSLQEKDFLEFQSQELADAKLIEGELEEIEKQITLLANAELIKSKLNASTFLISEKEDSILLNLNELKSNLQTLSPFNNAFEQLCQRVDSLIIELKDIDFEINTSENETEVNPETLELLTDRFDQLNKLIQKHRVHSLEELIQIENDINLKLLNFSDQQDKIEALEVKKIEIMNQLYEIGTQISNIRKQKAPEIEKSVTDYISIIGMPNGKLQIEIEKTDHFFENGMDRVTFLFSANKGIPLAEIEKVASGGEMSRLMLAIKAVISESTFLPTVILDEIDTGISGDIAYKVAKLMQKMASDRQLLVITHLPQIAAKSKLHYFVYKEIIDNKTYTNVKQVIGEERIEAIARMISGDTISESAKNTAKELITLN